jgi:hypothetical protein
MLSRRQRGDELHPVPNFAVLLSDDASSAIH